MNQRHLAKAVTWLERKAVALSDRITAQENRETVVMAVFALCLVSLVVLYHTS